MCKMIFYSENFFTRTPTDWSHITVLKKKKRKKKENKDSLCTLVYVHRYLYILKLQLYIYTSALYKKGTSSYKTQLFTKS